MAIEGPRGRTAFALIALEIVLLTIGGGVVVFGGLQSILFGGWEVGAAVGGAVGGLGALVGLLILGITYRVMRIG